MVVLFSIQQASDLYDSDLEEVYVDLQTREPFPRRDLCAPSTLFDLRTRTSISRAPARAELRFPLNHTVLPVYDSLFYYGQRCTLEEV
jgi:hypothetical protein